MFTIKYRTLELAPQQPSDGPSNYTFHEQIHGPFHMVSQEVDSDGHTVVHAHRDDCSPGMMFGPWAPAETAGSPRPGPTLWVMNEQGATIAKYDL